MKKSQKKGAMAMSREVKEMKINYREVNGVLLPDLELPPTREIGKYGRIALEYIKEKRQIFYFSLLMEGQLNIYLADLNAAIISKAERLSEEMLLADPAPDKATQQMAWVGHMNNISARAEEIVLQEMIYD